MNRLLLILLLMLTAITQAHAQKRHTVKPAMDTVKPYGKTYIKPHFSGGDSALQSYTKKNLKYPDAARESNITGRVVVQFMVDEKGLVSRVKVIRGIGGGCDEEATRVVKAMPLWVPASYKNKTVSAVEVLPIVFDLQ